MKRTWGRAIVVGLFAVFSTCGGEDGSGSFPRIVSTEPANGAVNVPTDATIMVTFDQSVEGALFLPAELDAKYPRGDGRKEGTEVYLSPGGALGYGATVDKSNPKLIKVRVTSTLPFDSSITASIFGRLPNGNAAGGSSAKFSTVSSPTVSAQIETSMATTDGLNVYAVDGGSQPSGTIRKVPLGGGAVSNLVTGRKQIHGIATDGKNVYWVEPVDGSTTSLFRVPIAGGDVQVLISSGGTFKFGYKTLSASEGKLYFEMDTDDRTGTTKRVLAKASTDDGTIQAVADLPRDLDRTVAGGSSVFGCVDPSPGSSESTGEIFAFAFTSSAGTATTIATGIATNACDGLAARSGSAYFASGDYSIMKVSSDGGAPQEVGKSYAPAPVTLEKSVAATGKGPAVSSVPDGAVGVGIVKLAFDGESYWVAGYVLAKTDGKNNAKLIASIPSARPILLWTDAKKVYYLDGKDGTVHMFDK
ncbi:MAG: Ig-like domain-containing protein [Nitrospirae bacterium]|nr:Ig-like domain-containing protein [Nitrospirota bacterium]